MNELLYDVNSGLIAVILLVSMVAAIELGYRVGFARCAPAGDDAKVHINGIQAAILGILALLLGFTLSLSLQRFDSRSEAVVDEANAIGTAYLRVQLIPAPMRRDVQVLMRDYVDLRVQAGALTPTDRAGREALLARAALVQAALWDAARKAVEADPARIAPTLFVEAVNQLFDSTGKRDASLARHVPEMVLLLLYATFLMAGGIVGFASGIAGHRPSLASHIMVVLIVVLVFIVLDLDRPRRGFIQVSQKSMTDLQATIVKEVGAAGQAAAATAR